MTNLGLHKKIGKAQINKLFKEGYELAFLSKKKQKPWPKIFELWHETANLRHLRSQFYLATCYDFGLGVNKNIPEAFNWYLKAAKQGKMEAQYNIGIFYINGEL